jgi:hypothetical protein
LAVAGPDQSPHNPDDTSAIESINDCRADADCNKTLRGIERAEAQKQAKRALAEANKTDQDRAMEWVGLAILCGLAYAGWRLLVR